MKSVNPARKRTRRASGRGSVVKQSTVLVEGETDETSSEISEDFDVPLSGNQEPAYVSVTGGMTKNLGDYNSAKLSVTVTLPFDYTGEDSEVRDAYAKSSALVDEFLDEEYKKAVGEEE